MLGKACHSEKLSQNGRRKQETGAALMAGITPIADDEKVEDEPSTKEMASKATAEAEATKNEEESTIDGAQETASVEEQVCIIT
jgi:hypothetical protein